MNVIAQPIIFILFSFFTFACDEDMNVSNNETTEKVEEKVIIDKNEDQSFHEHKLWDELTKSHVTTNGFVNYKGFINDSVKLNRYLDLLSANHPNDTWSSNERKAYWINAYNAFTIKLIVDNYPMKTIKDLGGSIYKVNTPWDIKFIKIGEEEYDLNNIEHGILRDQWKDPRIHAAVNCASVSCPALMKGAYTANKLETQLDSQMKRFILDGSKNSISKDKVKLSKIFKWFTGDFKSVSADVISYINKFSDVQVSEDVEIDYFDYDWNLNDAQ